MSGKIVASFVTALALIGATLTAARSQAPPRPLPIMTPDAAATVISANLAAFDLGTRYLYNSSGQGGLADLAHLFGAPNPNGGGAPDSPSDPRYRTWAEDYGVQSRNDAVANIPGDKRHSAGAVAGFGMLVSPGITLNASIDQSHTKINVAEPPQQGQYDLTQFGMSGAIQTGPWTVSGAVVRGDCRTEFEPNSLSGPSTARYNGGLWGGLADLSYYVALGRMRLVPRVGTDWLRSRTDPYAEQGGLLPASVPALTISRTRIFAGGEIGQFWMLDKTMIDVSAYGRLVDIVSYNAPQFAIAPAAGIAISQPIQPPTESRLGYETGAMASLRISPLARLYATYDARFRGGFEFSGWQRRNRIQVVDRVRIHTRLS